jgi:hypothetical protein
LTFKYGKSKNSYKTTVYVTKVNQFSVAAPADVFIENYVPFDVAVDFWGDTSSPRVVLTSGTEASLAYDAHTDTLTNSDAKATAKGHYKTSYTKLLRVANPGSTYPGPLAGVVGTTSLTAAFSGFAGATKPGATKSLSVNVHSNILTPGAGITAGQTLTFNPAPDDTATCFVNITNPDYNARPSAEKWQSSKTGPIQITVLPSDTQVEFTGCLGGPVG